ncbi:7054_t:CDS:2, partial [Funneliformis mosseae]
KGHISSIRRSHSLSIQRSRSLSVQDSRGHSSSIKNLRGHNNNHSSTIIDSRKFGNSRLSKDIIMALSKVINVLTEE